MRANWEAISDFVEMEAFEVGASILDSDGNLK